MKLTVAHPRSRCIPRLFMHCRSGNVPIIRIARKFGMDIVVGSGDADAYLELQVASLAASGARETQDTKLPSDEIPLPHSPDRLPR